MAIRFFHPFDVVPVRLLVTAHLPPTYTQKGDLRKHQPKPLGKGDTVYAKLQSDGSVTLFPFDMAGTGYELVENAIEGIHYDALASEENRQKEAQRAASNPGEGFNIDGMIALMRARGLNPPAAGRMQVEIGPDGYVPAQANGTRPNGS